MVNFPFRIGSRWYPGRDPLDRVVRAIERRRSHEERLRQVSLFKRATGEVIA